MAAPDPKRQIAFLIAAHNDPKQLARLVSRLHPHPVFIHWDAKAGARPVIPNATFTARSIPVYWAGYSQVLATVELIKTAIQHQETYLRIVLISGSCYPCRPVSQLESLFESDHGRNYLNSVIVKDSPHLKDLVSRPSFRDGLIPWRISSKIFNYKFEKLVRKITEMAIQLTPTRNPASFEMFHGSSWWALNTETCRFILNALSREKFYEERYKRTFAPDEQIFHSIVNNGAIDQRGDIINYEGRGTFRTANLHIVHPSLSKWYDLSDLEAITKSKKFFVRKVKSGISDELLDALDQQA